MKSFLMAVGIWPTTLFVANPAFAQGFDNREWWMSNWGWGHMAFGGVMMVVFWGGIILLVVLLARGFGGGERRDAPSRQSPIDILQERFAKGEIDQKEYDDRRRTLFGTR
ncbi:putative membrane protein [Mesorhizobium tianshanense]|uniref:Putative membrane protein n=2 Tax=Mesorhizobium tianshanense TaxID=39844 RepID=A0A562MVX1_9HYPH|nr:putative membrane protein [Mesorhizobium tianshanense]